jgi:hypothetical protein
MRNVNARVKEHLLAGLIGLISFIVYLITLAPAVSFVDNGELITVSCLLGIAHPTGYPLFTLIGRLWSMMPISTEVIRLNYLAAIYVAVAGSLFFKICLIIMRSTMFSDLSKKRETGEISNAQIGGAVAGTLMLVFSTTFWSQSAVFDVYSLHLVLLGATIFLFLKGMEKFSANGETISREYLAFTFVLGLSFTNSMTTILLAPAFLYLFFSVLGFSRDAWRVIAYSIPLFLLGLSLYLYLPIRANELPPNNWGYPATWERFLWHVTGKQFQVWMFSGMSVAKEQFAKFVSQFPTEFGYPVIAVGCLGVYYSIKRSKKLFIFIALLFLGCLTYSINYSIHDIESYFLLAFLSFGFFIVLGLEQIRGWLGGTIKVKQVSYYAVLCLLPIVQLAGNIERVSQADMMAVEDFTMAILREAEPNALILSFQWDHFVAPSLYFQRIRKIRPDITIVDKELLRRSWYLKELERNFPGLIGQSRTYVELFLAELTKFEHDQPYDGAIIEMRFRAMINDFIDKGITEHPVYLGPEIESEFGTNYKKVPAGLLLRLFRVQDSVDVKEFIPVFRPTRFKSDYTDQVRAMVVRCLLNYTKYFLFVGDSTKAVRYIDKALQFEPVNPAVIAMKKEILQTKTTR